MRVWALLLAVVAAGPVWAQAAHLRVDAPAGQVVVDGARLGAAGEWVEVEPGTREVALVDDVQAWDPRRAATSLAVAPGDSLTVALVLPTRLRIETLPIRATVTRERTAGADTLGTAPLTVETDGGPVTLVVTLDGYETVRRVVAPGTEAVTVVLPLRPDATPAVALLPTERSTVGRTALDVGIAAATLAAGAVAVHYKFRADRVDDRYRAEGTPDYADETLRQEALRLDRYSAVALGAMQVGVGVFALRFVLR